MNHIVCIVCAVPPSEVVQLAAGSLLPVWRCSEHWLDNILTVRESFHTWLMQSTTFCASGPANSRTAFRSSCDFNSALRVGTRLVEVISREMNSCHGVIEGVEMSVWALIPVDHLPTLCRRPVPPHNNLPKQSMLASIVNSAPVPVMVQPTAPTSTITLSAAYQLISTSPSPARIPRSSRVRAQRRPVPVWPAQDTPPKNAR